MLPLSPFGFPLGCADCEMVLATMQHSPLGVRCSMFGRWQLPRPTSLPSTIIFLSAPQNTKDVQELPFSLRCSTLTRFSCPCTPQQKKQQLRSTCNIGVGSGEVIEQQTKAAEAHTRKFWSWLWHVECGEDVRVCIQTARGVDKPVVSL